VNPMGAKSLDPKRLQREAHKAQAARPEPAIGRETTGVTRAVRETLPVIQKLRKAQITWAAIAAAMTEQGITQGNGLPLTATRLTAVVGHVERQIRRHEDSLALRRLRTDLARSDTETLKAPLREAIAENGSSDLPGNPTEEELRRAGLDELRSLLRKD